MLSSPLYSPLTRALMVPLPTEPWRAEPPTSAMLFGASKGVIQWGALSIKIRSPKSEVGTF
jgi:hypothetical protein